MEIIFTCAYPAAGKTTLVERFAGHDRLNRDTIGGSLLDVAAELEQRIKAGKKQFILDNTYGTRESRKPLVEIAKRHKMPLRCIWLDTSIEDAQMNACHRMVKRFGKLLHPAEITAAKDPNTFPIMALFAYRKAFEEPTESEGFKLEVVKFERKKNPAFKNKAVIFDYDGTLRETKSGAHFPTDVADIRILPGRAAKIKKYAADGYKLLGVSNQSGVAKGDLTLETADACFKQTNKLLGLDIEYSFCPHRAPPTCYCRKPMVGLGVQFIEKHSLDPAQCVFIGDMTTDKTFANRCGFQFMDQAEFFKP